MRVIAGTAKGRILKAPKGMHTRPTIDRVKEAIFSVLGAKVEGAKVLDAFAGSGSLSVEALSRGAEFAVLIEKDYNALMAIKSNLTSTGFETQSKVIKGQTEKALQTLTAGFDLIFLDPPYNQGLIEVTEKIIIEKALLAPKGIVVLETNSKLMEVLQSPIWQLLKTSIYGDTAVLYYGLGCDD